MSLKSSLRLNAEEIFENTGDTSFLTEGNVGTDISWKWPEELGTGTISRIKLKEGLSLGWGCFQVFEDITLSVLPVFCSPAVFHFFSPQSGSYSFQNANKNDCHKKFNVGLSGFGSICSMGKFWEGSFQFNRDMPVEGVSLFVDTPLLHAFMEGRYDQFPKALCDIAEGDTTRFFNQIFALPPVACMVIKQLLHCPYTGTFRRFYFEAKALELLTFTMAQLATGRADTTLPNMADALRVKKVRKILADNLETPPSLDELAKLAGTNRDKLNSDFRRLCGTSVFGFFRECRLEQARILLEDKKMSVTEVAFEVGYAHQQSFTKAFKRHFGTNPTEHLY